MNQADQKYVRIELTQHQYAVINAEDALEINRFQWCFHSGGYATRRKWDDELGKFVSIKMHRQIVGFPDGMEVDHIDGNGLNNSRSNLRVCSKEQNQRNRNRARHNKCGLKGVYQVGKKWRSCIDVNQKSVHLGTFNSPQEAHEAYLSKAKEIHGEYFRDPLKMACDFRDVPILPRASRSDITALKTPKGKTASGFRGVYFRNGSWVAATSWKNKWVHIGRFLNPELASAAVEAKIKELRPFAA